MNVLYLADSPALPGLSDPVQRVLSGAPCPAWPRLKAEDSRARMLRNNAWSLADARRHCEARPAPRTLRGGVQYVPDPEAHCMAPPAIGTVSLFR